jgi:hypothetical protein
LEVTSERAQARFVSTPTTLTPLATAESRARICYPIDNFEYGMLEFAIYDNNGYLLQFGQPLTATP